MSRSNPQAAAAAAQAQSRVLLSAQAAQAKATQASLSQRLAQEQAARQSATNQLDFIQATPQSALNVFGNTPMYQLAFGNQPMQSNQGFLQQLYASPEYQLQFGDSAQAQSMDPLQRFQADPGYQFAQQEGLKALQQSAAPRGLLESGSLQRELANFNQGLASQQYGSWLGRQGTAFDSFRQARTGIYGNYQDRLAALANMGSSVNGSNNALNLGTGLSNLSSQLGQMGMNAYSGLGMGGLNSYTQGGIAQADSIMKGAQIDSQNNQAQSAQMGQLASGAGQLIGKIL
jgi:hypothetical protein